MAATTFDKPLDKKVSELSDQIAKLNSNKNSLKLWVGTADFVFNNTDSASVSIATLTGNVVTQSNIVGALGFPIGYERATYGTASNKLELIMQAHQTYNLTISAMVVLFYT